MNFESAIENESSWDCENELSDSGIGSDYAAINNDQSIEDIQMNGWNTVVNRFSYQLSKPVKKYYSEYNCHTALDFEESKDVVMYFSS